ncbi:MAG: HesA/MoeB/ThiF family protein [Halanaerobiales bacterium]|nr:HesA/MoeB/ThiF family protein [Halanaerobiales bacterium]
MDYWARQKLMFKPEEQEKIREMVVMIVGVGGLGTHQAQELQRIGVKKIYLVDFDLISPGNLNRQIFYGRKDLKGYKVDVAKKYLDQFELGTEIIAHNQQLNPQMEIPLDVNIIFDALDTFKARLILETLAEQYQLPLIHGGIYAWYGQITTIIPGQTKKLSTIFPATEEQEQIPAFSPLVALVASLQVIEGVKVYLHDEQILANRLLLIDASDYSFEIINL